MLLIIATQYTPGDKVFVLHKGKIREAEVKRVNGRLIIPSGGSDIIFDLKSVTLDIKEGIKFDAEPDVTIDASNKNVHHFIFKTREEAVASLITEL